MITSDNFSEDLFKQEMQTMDNRLTDMEEKMNSIDTKLTQVVDAILGNPLTQSGGFAKELKDMRIELDKLKDQVKDHDDFKKRVYWTGAIVASIVLLIQYFSNIYSNIKK
jgi:hypothetical protein